MKFETLIFDLDGTISDPSEGIVNCVNHALSTCGYAPADPSRIRQWIGPPLTEIFEAMTAGVDEQTLLDLIAVYRERYAETGYRENILYDGIAAVTESLAVSGASLGICTSKRADYAAQIIEMFNLDEYFSFVDGGDIHIKKYMQLERLIVNGLNPGSAVMIGDRAVDIEAAKRNGIASVGVCWGFGEEKELKNARPDHLALAPADLLEIFS